MSLIKTSVFSNKSPVIILGMHRSGTTMVTRMLEELGLFVGCRLGRNGEAHFFQRINDWLFEQCSSGWESPSRIRHIVDNDDVRNIYVKSLRGLLESPRVIEYLGVKNYLRMMVLNDLPKNWGWKDPRNVFTLPLWLDLFPDAKVLHISRHGIDVGASLASRYEKEIARLLAGDKLKELQIKFGKLPYRVLWTHRSTTVEEGVKLWLEYEQQATAAVEINGINGMKVRFEDFTDDPDRLLKEIANFCNLDCSDAVISSAAKKFQSSRANAYEDSPVLRELYAKYRDAFQALGY